LVGGKSPYLKRVGNASKDQHPGKGAKDFSGRAHKRHERERKRKISDRKIIPHKTKRAPNNCAGHDGEKGRK